MKNSHPRIKLTSLLAAACLGLASAAFAVDPPPGGGYPNATTAVGDDALFSLTTGSDNTAVGFEALFNVTNGNYNTAIGSGALIANTSASGNTAIGWEALHANTTGSGNMASGSNALQNNTTGSSNTACGTSSLNDNTTGTNNTATGFPALQSNTSGNSNTADGYNALGYVTTGSNNIGLGQSAGTKLKTGNNNIYIANVGAGTSESGTIRIGTSGPYKNTFVAGVSGVTVAGGVGVIVDAMGHLGTLTSSARYKDAIRPMDKASEALLALQPVTFRYKKDLDPDAIPQFGLVAEQVEKVDPDLVARDEQGKPYTVRYEAVNAMLLNEFLKEHRKVEEQVATIADVKATVAKQDRTIAHQQKEFRATVDQQQKEITALTAALKAQAAQIEKVSDQLEVSKAAPRVVVNNQ